MPYVIVGLDLPLDGSDYDGGLSVLLSHDPVRGTESVEIVDGIDPRAQRFDVFDDAAEMANRLLRADARYFPPFHPVIAEVWPEGLGALVLADDDRGGGDIERAAARWALAVKWQPASS